MLREDHDVGAAMPGRPTREDRRDYIAGLAKSPARWPLTRERAIELHRRLDALLLLTPTQRRARIFGREVRP